MRTESIITQLVFNHALRVRVKAETDDDTIPSHNGKVVNKDMANSSTLNDNHPGIPLSLDLPVESHTDVFEQPESAAPENGAQESTNYQAAPGKSKAGNNLVGKITNLCTSDLGNIVGSRDFLLLCEYLFSPSNFTSIDDAYPQSLNFLYNWR